MTTIRLVLPKTNTGHCRSCGAVIDWYLTPKGKGMPMNAGAEPIAKTELLDPDIGTFDTAQTHWSSCPDGPTWKRAP